MGPKSLQIASPKDSKPSCLNILSVLNQIGPPSTINRPQCSGSLRILRRPDFLRDSHGGSLFCIFSPQRKHLIFCEGWMSPLKKREVIETNPCFGIIQRKTSSTARPSPIFQGKSRICPTHSGMSSINCAPLWSPTKRKRCLPRRCLATRQWEKQTKRFVDGWFGKGREKTSFEEIPW